MSLTVNAPIEQFDIVQFEVTNPGNNTERFRYGLVMWVGESETFPGVEILTVLDAETGDHRNVYAQSVLGYQSATPALKAVLRRVNELFPDRPDEIKKRSLNVLNFLIRGAERQ